MKPIAATIATKLFEIDEKTIKKGFAALSANELEYLCTNNVGSHFIQNCLRLSESKDRSVWLQSIFDRLQGRLMILATNKSGSFVMETLWSVGNLKQRLSIVDELKSSEVQLKNDKLVILLTEKNVFFKKKYLLFFIVNSLKKIRPLSRKYDWAKFLQKETRGMEIDSSERA